MFEFGKTPQKQEGIPAEGPNSPKKGPFLATAAAALALSVSAGVQATTESVAPEIDLATAHAAYFAAIKRNPITGERDPIAQERAANITAEELKAWADKNPEQILAQVNFETGFEKVNACD